MKKLVAILMVLAMTMSFASAMAEEPLKIGVIGPLTGGAAVYGNAVAYGAHSGLENSMDRGA